MAGPIIHLQTYSPVGDSLVLDMVEKKMGPNQVVNLDANGTFVSATNITNREFYGFANGDPLNYASMVIDYTGLYGSIRLNGASYSYQPVNAHGVANRGLVRESVVGWRMTQSSTQINPVTICQPTLNGIGQYSPRCEAPPTDCAITLHANACSKPLPVNGTCQTTSLGDCSSANRNCAISANVSSPKTCNDVANAQAFIYSLIQGAGTVQPNNLNISRVVNLNVSNVDQAGKSTADLWTSFRRGNQAIVINHQNFTDYAIFYPNGRSQGSSSWLSVPVSFVALKGQVMSGQEIKFSMAPISYLPGSIPTKCVTVPPSDGQQYCSPDPPQCPDKSCVPDPPCNVLNCLPTPPCLPVSPMSVVDVALPSCNPGQPPCLPASPFILSQKVVRNCGGCTQNPVIELTTGTNSCCQGGTGAGQPCCANSPADEVQGRDRCCQNPCCNSSIQTSIVGTVSNPRKSNCGGCTSLGELLGKLPGQTACCNSTSSPSGLVSVPRLNGCNSDLIMHISFWTDLSTVEEYPDWANRAQSANAAGAYMWSSETGITVEIDHFYSTAKDFVGNTCGALKPFGDFVNALRSQPKTPDNDVNVDALLMGNDVSEPGTSGCSNVDHEGTTQNQALHPVTIDPAQMVVIRTVDHTADTYWPAMTSHLALTVGHELTHSAGEDTHPYHSDWFTTYWSADCDSHGANCNLMHNGATYPDRSLWRTGESYVRNGKCGTSEASWAPDHCTIWKIQHHSGTPSNYLKLNNY